MEIIESDFIKLAPLNCSELKIALRRFGNEFDGGYVVPSDYLKDSRYLISFGYGHDFSFEKEIANEYKNIKIIHLYDKSINFRFLIKQLFVNLALHLFRRNVEVYKSFSNLGNYIQLTLNSRIKLIHQNIGINSDQISCKNAIEVVCPNDYSIVLKCDIEGDEYFLIDDFVYYHKKISVLIIEFHGLILDFDKFQIELGKLLDKFAIVNVNINNYSIEPSSSLPDAVEVTLLNLSHLKEIDVLCKSNSTINDFNRPNNYRTSPHAYRFI
jgi:hypothetical protein